ncbi:hypothetical protein ESCO_006327 [Escovopsis weberi]|uniref:Transmembrane protein 69 n=1 Tax=Escovopsis weberi TaxID=150374 RepID=A0A0M9VUM8_ESCWE|nr:hypothetical protein ESCO_006327 [Escovopsis weberi]
MGHPPGQSREEDHPRKLADETIKSQPEHASAARSAQAILEGTQDGKDLKHDIRVVKETLRLTKIPKESHILGLAGTVPYLATSLSTIYLAWDLTKELPTKSGFMDAITIDHDTARQLLDIIEPLQLGYGAVIISFLGAIHWGLEYAEKDPDPDRTRFRYGMGLAASIAAWPTLLMPIEFSLIAQFMAFMALYYADARATYRGWAPSWYAKYRFLLTAMVGLSIFVSLVGRAKIQQRNALSKQELHAKLSRTGLADTETDWAKLEEEEMRRARNEKEEAEKKSQEEEEDHKKQRGKTDDEGEAHNKNKGEQSGKDLDQSIKGKDDGQNIQPKEEGNPEQRAE